jgi:hypothetical protein
MIQKESEHVLKYENNGLLTEPEKKALTIKLKIVGSHDSGMK